jgi:Putative transposase/Transposase zinc-binding domain
MPRPALELADIFRLHGSAYRAARRLPRQQLRVLRAIEVCRTAALGGHVEQCSQCSHLRISYNSCRNRHCPKCQNTERARWLQRRTAELLPVEYFHVVFTLPAEMAALAFYNQEVVYGILFRTAAQTLLAIARDPKHLGAAIGFFGILHTWGQNLLFHPHLHCVVPGGGLSPDGQSWIACRPGFFLPVRVLSRLFRRLFLEALQDAFGSGKLRFCGEREPLQDAAEFARYLAPLGQTEWVVYAKPPFGGPQQVLAYLGRYTHRVAISNQRLLAHQHGTVTFQWKDYRRHGREKSRVMTLAAHEFMRRFLIHTLPDRFQRIRHFGFLANRQRREKLALCRRLLLHPITQLLPETAAGSPPELRCPVCGAGIRVHVLPAYRWPNQPPDTS